MQIHVVQSGQTLYGIARTYGISVADLSAANQINPIQTLVIGQALVIPISGMYYFVQPGDTLYKIGRRFGVNHLRLAQMNAINPIDPLQIGFRLYIPPAPKTPVESNAYVEAVKNSKFLEYRKQLDEMRRTLEKFVSVQSRVQIFADALASYQKKAQELMQSIDTLSPVQEETVTSFKEKTAGPAAFLSALECTNLYTDKGMALLKDIAENYYTQNISYGLSGHQYFLPKPAEAIPAPKEPAPVAVPVANAVETEEAMTTAASDVSAPEAVAETAIPETVSAPFGNDTDNSEAERWRKLGIDDPQAYLYPA